MSNPGYGKRSAPDQLPSARDDFALLPTRERYVAGFVDHLPEGAAMSVKQLAKHLPLYGQQAISTALRALSVAGHLRRVRCTVGAGDETRWVFRTFWSRTARDSEWWNTYLATENASQTAAPAAPGALASDAAPAPPWAPAEEPPPFPSQPEDPAMGQAPEATAVPHQRTPPREPAAKPTHPDPEGPPATPRTTSEVAPTPAYLALARLGRDDHRLALSADDCAALESHATEWLARGVTVDYLTSALAAGLPAQVDSPVGLLRRRLIDKVPPRLPAQNTSPDTPALARRILVECTDCGRPGPSEALPDGLCRPCHEAHSGSARSSADLAEIAEIADVKAHMANLRDLLKPV